MERCTAKEKIELFYTDLLKLVRKLAKIDSEKYLPKVVKALSLLATLHGGYVFWLCCKKK